MQDYVVSQRRMGSTNQMAGLYVQQNSGVQTMVTTADSAETSSGRHSYAFWLLVAVVLLVAVFNLLITLTLISVLRISIGMESVQVVEGGLVMPGSVDLDKLYKPDGSFLGFADEPTSVNGIGKTVDLVVSASTSRARFDSGDSQRLRLSADGVRVEGVPRAAVWQADGAPFFNTFYPNFELPAGVRSLRVADARTRRVVSPVDRSLRLLSSTQTHLKGSEGTYVRGKELVVSADQELYLKSVNGSVSLAGAAGVRLDVRGIPWAQGRRGAADARAAYRLCACLPAGQLFLIPVPLDNGDRAPAERVTCANAALHGENNPCTV